jgi:CrcB protein
MTNAPRPKGLAAMVCAVALGGAVGTLLRDVALRIDNTAWFRSAVGTHGWASRVPWILGAINLIGVYFATFTLRGPLARHDPNNLTRLLVITGFFGGFTSYSSLYVSLGSIWHVSVTGALLTVAVAVASGIAAAWLGAQSWTK